MPKKGMKYFLWLSTMFDCELLGSQDKQENNSRKIINFHLIEADDDEAYA